MIVFLCLFVAVSLSARDDQAPLSTSIVPGITYTNYRIASVPWSIHVVQVPRANPAFEFHTRHARGWALGLGTVSSQVAQVTPALGLPIVGINGDFYQRERVYAGDPRGLQIIEGEVISAPVGGVCFWVDGFNQPHATNVYSLFQVTWPDGASTRCGLNEERHARAVVLYTPALGTSTRTTGGREFILEPQTGSPWLPLQSPRAYVGRVTQINEAGDSPLRPGTLVVSVAPELLSSLPKIESGATLTISTTTVPSLRGVRTAIGGGPVLVRNRKRQKNGALAGGGYEVTSMVERHPRSAIGWNDQSYFLVEVDGRQNDLSVGMTLEELAGYMLDLGCDEAMSLDGGGSSTLWYAGHVRNRPCDGHERPIANSLVVVQKTPSVGTTNASFSR
jgi:hypothetical protein